MAMTVKHQSQIINETRISHIPTIEKLLQFLYQIDSLPMLPFHIRFATFGTIKQNMNVIASLMLFFAVTARSIENSPLTQVVMKNARKGATDVTIQSTVQDFLAFIQTSDMWCDKSWLIHQVWTCPSDVLMITGATRWGKTTNINMIRFHAEFVIDANGKVMNVLETNAYKYFIEGKVVTMKQKMNETEFRLLEEKLDHIPLIARDSKTNRLHLASHPVIYLQGSLLDMKDVKSFASMVSAAYMEHTHLRQHLHPNQLEIFNQFESVNLANGVPQNMLMMSIQLLCEMLYEAYNREVVILMDEHDHYLRKAYLGDAIFQPTAETETFLSSYKQFMRITFKDNNYLAKGIITGVLEVAEATSLSDMNNARLIHVLSDFDYSPYYGIYQHEYDTLMSNAGLNTSFIQNATNWYDGYRTLHRLDEPMFSTYSVSKCISEKAIKNYWTTSSIAVFMPELFRRWELQEITGILLRDWNPAEKISRFFVSKKRENRFTKNELAELQLLQLHQTKFNPERHRHLVFRIFIAIGLVTYSPDTQGQTDRSEIRIPNMEIYDHMKTLWITSMGIDDVQYSDCMIHIRNYACEKDQLEVLNALAKSFHDMLSMQAENQGFIAVNPDFRLEKKEKSGFKKPKPTGKFPKLVPSLTAEFQLPHLSHCITKPLLFNEATIEAFLFTTIRDALRLIGTEVPITAMQLDEGVDHIGRCKLDMFFVVKNTIAIIFENKYNRLKQTRTEPEDTLKQALSYTCFLNKYNLTGFESFKYLGVVVNENGRVELLSFTLSVDDLKKTISLADNVLDKARKSKPAEETKRKKDNYNNLSNTIWHETHKNNPTGFLRSVYPP